MTYLFDEDKNFFGLDGRLLASGKVYFCVPDGTANISTLKTIYTTHAMGVTASNPQTLTSTGRFAQEVHGTGLYDVVIKTAALATVRTLYNVPAGYAADAANVTFTPSSGASATDVQTFLRTTHARTADEIAAGVTPTNYAWPTAPYDPRRYGCDITGATNCTTALHNFYKVCMQSGASGHIPAGTYKLTTGVLVFDNGWVDKPWPNITTDGHDAVNFNIDSATETNAPLLKWSNGTALSAVGRYWRGGCHGGVTVNGSGTGTPYAAQHHFSFTGMWHVNLGWMASNNCKGSSFHIPQNLFSGNNPDPYASSFMAIEGLESNFAAGWGVLNENGLGMDGWVVEHVRIIQPSLGGWFGIGSGCTINNISCANTQTGYAFDDGTFVTNIAGSPQRNMIRVAEFDNCQLGVRLNVCTRTRIEAIRFVHRYQTTPNAAAVYWPTTAMSIGAGTSPSIADVYIDVSGRYESGGAIGAIGTWADFGNVAHGGIVVDVDYQDNGSLGLTDANFTGSNVNGSASISIRKRFVSLREQLVRRSILVRASTASTIPFHVTPTIQASNVLTFATELSDRSNMYDNSTYKATVPYTGLYHLFGRICFPSAVGTKVIIGFFADTNAALTRTDYSQNVGDQTYEISGVVLLTAGQLISFNGVQNTAGAINLTNPISASADLIWSMTQIA